MGNTLSVPVTQNMMLSHGFLFFTTVSNHSVDYTCSHILVTSVQPVVDLLEPFSFLTPEKWKWCCRVKAIGGVYERHSLNLLRGLNPSLICQWTHCLTRSGVSTFVRNIKLCCPRARILRATITRSHSPLRSGAAPDSSISSNVSWYAPWRLSWTTTCSLSRLDYPTLAITCSCLRSSRQQPLHLLTLHQRGKALSKEPERLHARCRNGQVKYGRTRSESWPLRRRNFSLRHNFLFCAFQRIGSCWPWLRTAAQKYYCFDIVEFTIFLTFRKDGVVSELWALYPCEQVEDIRRPERWFFDGSRPSHWKKRQCSRLKAWRGGHSSST